MKLISWNVRGLGRSEKKRAMKRLFSKEKCNMIFTQETKLTDVNLRSYRYLGGSCSSRGGIHRCDGCRRRTDHHVGGQLFHCGE